MQRKFACTIGMITSFVTAVTVALVMAGTAQAVPVAIDLGAGSSVSVAYPSPTPPASYSVSGTIYGDISATTFAITGGTLSLTGAGPDTEMTLVAGVLSLSGSGISDFGQGPFDIGVPPENPGYVLNNTGATGLLGDVFGSVTVGGSFDAEGFGLAEPGPFTHSMSSFFWFSSSVTPVPEPGTATLLAAGLVGLAVRRRTA